MPRQPRVYEPGISLHVIQRGNNGSAIFAENVDYWRLLALMRSASRIEEVHVHGFVLMTTHFHLLVTPQREQALARFMQRVDGEYAQYYNRQYGRMGTIWNGRYRGFSIRDERRWLTCLRYIEQNPVRAQMVPSPDCYVWSSYKTHGYGETCPWLKDHDCYLRLGPTSAARQVAYRAICGIPLTDSELKLQRKPPRNKSSGDLVEGLTPGFDSSSDPRANSAL